MKANLKLKNDKESLNIFIKFGSTKADLLCGSKYMERII